MKPSELHPTAAGLDDDDGRSAYQPGRRPRRVPPSETPTRRAERSRKWRAKRAHCRVCNTSISRGGTGLCRVCAKSARRRATLATKVRRELAETFQRGRSPQHERRISQLHTEQLRLPL